MAAWRVVQRMLGHEDEAPDTGGFVRTVFECVDDATGRDYGLRLKYEQLPDEATALVDAEAWCAARNAPPAQVDGDGE